MKGIRLPLGNKRGKEKFLREVMDGRNGMEPLSKVTEWIEGKKKIIEERMDFEEVSKKKGFFLCISSHYYAAVAISKFHKKNFFNEDHEVFSVSKFDIKEAATKFIEAKEYEWK